MSAEREQPSWDEEVHHLIETNVSDYKEGFYHIIEAFAFVHNILLNEQDSECEEHSLIFTLSNGKKIRVDANQLADALLPFLGCLAQDRLTDMGQGDFCEQTLQLASLKWLGQKK